MKQGGREMIRVVLKHALRPCPQDCPQQVQEWSGQARVPFSWVTVLAINQTLWRST